MEAPTTRPGLLASDQTDVPASEDRPRELSKDEINALPLRAYHGPVAVVDQDEAVDEAVRSLKGAVLGFDIEARPCFKRGENHPPALVQLCGPGLAVLFRIQKLSLPNGLWRLFEDPSVLKVGVGLQRDVKDLQSVHSFWPEGFVELTSLSAPLGIKAAGLRSLAANLLEFRIGKGAQTSNWEAPALSSGQIAYAATDAWVGREIYLALDALREEASLPPPEPLRFDEI